MSVYGVSKNRGGYSAYIPTTPHPNGLKKSFCQTYEKRVRWKCHPLKTLNKRCYCLRRTEVPRRPICINGTLKSSGTLTGRNLYWFVARVNNLRGRTSPNEYHSGFPRKKKFDSWYRRRGDTPWRNISSPKSNINYKYNGFYFSSVLHVS